MFKIFKYFKKWHWAVAALILGITVGQVVLELMLPELTSSIIYYVSKGLSESTSYTNEIISTGLKMALICFGIVVLMIVVGFLSSRLSTDFAKTLRGLIYSKIDSFSKYDKDKFQTASLITRTTNDVTQVQMITMMMMRMFMVAPIMVIVAIVKVIGLARTDIWDMSFNILIGVSTLVLMIIIIFSIVMPKFKELQKNLDELNHSTKENLAGVRVVRAYNAEEYQTNKFEKTNEKLTKTNTFVNVGMSFFWPGMNLIFRVLNLSITVVGVFLISKGFLITDIGTGLVDYSLGVGTINEFTQYSNQIFMSFMMLSMLFVMIPRGSVSAKRINEVLDTTPSIANSANLIPFNTLRDPKGKLPFLQFDKVCFKYEDAEECVIKNISFNAYLGETIAFIGSTGSGKSTLINLVPRFYDVTDGAVKIGGINIKDLDIEELRGLIGYVPQKGFLFNDTIEGNLKLGKADATKEEMDQALNIAQADFVNDYEDGINHLINQGGKNVSGGQKQRLSIARAIVRNPKIYIFDDSFSALDYKTDKAVRNALKERTKNALTLIVSQRIGTIMNADKIVLLDQGKMVAVGTHKELLKTSREYQEMAYSQLSKEELADASR